MAEPAQGMTQSNEMRQEQTLTPQQLQSLDILYAPVLELQQKINQELASNPILELADPEPEELPEIVPDNQNTELGSERGDMDDELTKILEMTASGYISPTEASLPSGFDPEDEEERQAYLFDSIPDEISMQEQLLEQLRCSDADPETMRIAEAVIGGIDESGYLKTHPADIATGAGCSIEQAEKAIQLVQSFEPPGIGARDLKECLIIQLKRLGRATPELLEIIQNHLDDIARNKLPQLAKALNIPLEQLNADIAEIKRLNPYPGNLISDSKPVYIVPEVTVERDGDDFKVVSDDSCIPRLRISKFYLKLLEDPATPDDVRSYIAIANKYIRTPVGLFDFKYFFTSGFQSKEGEEISSRGVKEMIRDLIDKENPASPLSDSKLTALLKERGLDVARRTVAKYREELGIQSSHLRRSF